VSGRATFRLVSFGHRGAANFELRYVMVEDALVNRNHAGKVCRGGAGTWLDVTEVRRGLRLRAETQKKEVDAAHRFQLLGVTGQFALQVCNVSAHRGEAFDLAEKGFAQESAEVRHEVERVLHAQRGEGVLRENVQAAEHIIKG